MNTLFKVFIFFVMFFGVQRIVFAKPSRVKRVSDSYLTDLKTKLALSKMDKVAITIPVSAGLRDPMSIGRRRRSQSRFLDVLFNQSEEDNGDPMALDYDDYKINFLKFNK
ncbi:unnamed protein product [Brassicogethes aeneus]|uniref:Uncharacterized protein n=1 Tax=Brassicogethes aeneus TaxID=1431903 RepID=A0A9P0AV86_BRAAE|nr:unnamed protein product [Brassicogethes aeneus]